MNVWTIHALRALFFVLLIVCRGNAEPPDIGEFEDTIPITDESFGAAVFSSTSALGREVDVTLIKSLRPVWNSPIRDLSGIECLTRLEIVNLRKQRVKALAPLAGLPELR